MASCQGRPAGFSVVAPPIRDLETPEGFDRVNLLMLRNPAAVNFLDRCALSIPCHEPGTAPVGVMLVGEPGADRRILSLGLAVEAALRRE